MPNSIPERSVGFILREARNAKNLSLEQVSKDTKIHIKILKSIEADDLQSLGLVYLKSFVRIYAEYLGLKKEEVIERLEAVCEPTQNSLRKIKIPSATPVQQFRIPNIDIRKVIIFVVSVSLVIGIVKFVVHRKTKKQVTKVTDSKKAELKRPVLEINEAAVTVKKVVKPVKKTKSEVSAKTVSSTVVQETEKIVLTIKAKYKSWLQVKIDGKTVFQGALAKGSAETWSAKENIELSLGDAGAFQLEFNGRLLEKIGRPGQTLKHVVLNKSGLTLQK